MEKSNVLRDFCLSLYKIGLALKYEKKPPDRSCLADSQSDKESEDDRNLPAIGLSCMM